MYYSIDSRPCMSISTPVIIYGSFSLGKMANRRPQNGGGRRMDYGRNDRGKNFNRSNVSPWQDSGPTAGLSNLLPLAGGSPEATLAFANNLINNLLQSRQNPVPPSLLDMPMRRDFGPDLGRFGRGYIPNRVSTVVNVLCTFEMLL